MSKVITKRYLADQVRRAVAAGDVSVAEKLDEREVFAKIDQVVNAMAKLGMFENMAQGEKNVSPHYVATFPKLEIEFDEDQELEFVKLPARYIALPHDKGIVTLAPTRDRFNPFIPVRHGQIALYANSPAGKMQGKIAFWPEGMERLYLYHPCNKRVSEEYSYLLLQLAIADSSSIKEDAPYPIDPAVEFDVITRVSAMFLPSKPASAQPKNHE